MSAVRYIRDWLNSSADGNTVHIWSDIQAYDAGNVNIALGKTATYFFQNNTYTAGAQVTDGDTTSGYNVAATLTTVPMTVDLGTAYDIKTVKIFHYYGDGRTFRNTKTEVSPDGTTWYTLFDSSVSGEYAETSAGKTYTVPTYSFGAGTNNLTAATSVQANTAATEAVPTGTWTIVPGGEQGSMTFASPTYLRYGADTRWAYLYTSGTVTFSNATFGDPASGTPKNGYYFVPSSGSVSLVGATTIQGATSTTGNITTSSSGSPTTAIFDSQWSAGGVYEDQRTVQGAQAGGTNSLSGDTTVEAHSGGTGVVTIPGSTIKNTTGATTVQGNTSATSTIAVGGNTKVLTAAASSQFAQSATSNIQIFVANQPEPVIPQSFGTWLKDQRAIRCVLIEVGVQVGGVETTRYLSNKAYVTGATDSPANTVYKPVVAGGVEFTESLSLDGSTSLSYGDIELYNIGGDKDSWLNDIWRNRSIKVYMGDVSWARNQFQMIFNGVVFDVDTRTRDRINLKLSDKLQRLNNPVTEVKLGGTSQNKDRLIPLCFGECFNVEPLLVDAANHEYQVHNGAIERIIEVRDNGVPVSFTEYVATGKFRLNQSPVGQITCSVQGDKYLGYITDVGSIIERIVTGYGHATQRFTSVDIDNTKLTAFKSANTAPVGIYLSERANVIEVCNQIADSVGARVSMSRSGLMYLTKIAIPRSDSGTTVTASNMVERSLTIADLPAVVASVQVGYAKNWTVQANIQTGIPSAHVAMFAQEWLTVTSADSNVASKYNLFTDPVMEETLLLRGTDATAECARRLALFSTQRKVIQYEGLPALLTEQLGNTQTVQHSRFGLSGGQAGQIISLKTSWLNPKVTVEVLI